MSPFRSIFPLFHSLSFLFSPLRHPFPHPFQPLSLPFVAVLFYITFLWHPSFPLLPYFPLSTTPSPLYTPPSFPALSYPASPASPKTKNIPHTLPLSPPSPVTPTPLFTLLRLKPGRTKLSGPWNPHMRVFGEDSFREVIRH